jgi:heme exporter protein B
MLKQISILVAKDLSLELKRPYLFNGMLLYMVSTVFVCYLVFEGIMDAKTWNALYWIVLLFAAVNSAGRSFTDEFSKRHLYYYSIANPAPVITGKMIYNTLLLIVLALLGFAAFALFPGLPEMNFGIFMLAALLGSTGLALLLSLVAGIAARAGNNFTLMAILSFPIVLPKLLILMNMTKHALQNSEWEAVSGAVIALLGLQALIIILALVLFPYLWKE